MRQLQLLLILLTAWIIVSCNSEKTAVKPFHFTADTPDTLVTEGTRATLLSSDLKLFNKLAGTVDFRPTKVRFQHVLINRAGEDEMGNRAVARTKSLQAVMYFDSITFQKMLDIPKTMDYYFKGHPKEIFYFDWLDKETLKELNESDEDYEGHPNFYFKTAGKTRLWFLNQKVLLIDSNC